MRALICHPGASWATHDVYAAAVEGLRAAGVHLAEWRLDGRIERWHGFLHYLWRRQKRVAPATGTRWPKPTPADTLHFATTGLVERALEKRCTDLIVVSAMFLPANKIELARRAGLRVWLLCTESPYDMADELRLAAQVDGVWTHERAMLEAFRAVNPCTAYLPHAWRPGVHDAPAVVGGPTCDVLFCGSLFEERIAFLEAIDWTGLDLALYGTTELLPKRSPLRQYVRGGLVSNAQLVDLARGAQVAINCFRTPPAGQVAESLNPRLYEMAAAGVCSVSDWRAEVPEIFGAAVPTFTTPAEAGAVIRGLLADPARRQQVRAQAQDAVRGATWIARGQQMVQDMARWSAQQGESYAEVSRARRGDVPVGHQRGQRADGGQSHPVVGIH